MPQSAQGLGQADPPRRALPGANSMSNRAEPGSLISGVMTLLISLMAA
ncbi:hypothetical protein H206_05380 [Candidatus Electrothrix aarhusensis]|uniref:Uncharacterized protein n=1 Tax=Candidatus Electrothrix aarhusensis TaxID=1859131 RepID=A0A3S3UE16_9BACT|nr:hypothetical protein H206_05380 [Candidatus Electrothrix aarhusensis]